jgi:pyrrolidone-carboxylate peptidase
MKHNNKHNVLLWNQKTPDFGVLKKRKYRIPYLVSDFGVEEELNLLNSLVVPTIITKRKIMHPTLIIVTAFGAFGDVTANPTQQMVEEFKEELYHFELSEQKIPVLYYIIPVSVEDCLLSLEEIKNQIKHYEEMYNTENVLLLHLGIDANARFMKMEQCGYNNMTFRIPDVRGYQPVSEPINNLCGFNDALHTSHPLTDVLQRSEGSVSVDVPLFFLKLILFS